MEGAGEWEGEGLGFRHYVRLFFTFFLVSVGVIASAQFFYLQSLDLAHILSRAAVVALSLTAFSFIKDRTQDIIPYPLLYAVALLLFAYLLLTEHPYASALLQWLFGDVAERTPVVVSSFPPAGEMENVEVALAIHREVNRVRAEEGLPPYAWDEQLAYIAYTYAKEMAEEGFFSHYGDGGPLARYEEMGYRCGKAAHLQMAGENLFKADVELLQPAFVVESWLNSSSHRRNILSRAFEREGIGVYVKGNTAYVVQDLC